MRFVQAMFLALLFIACLYSVLPNILTRAFGWFAVRRCSNDKRISLTFDDGPDPRYTSVLLDALLAADIRATFFVIADKALRHPDIIRRMVQEGHDVQVHGYSHQMVPFLGPRATERQIKGATDALLPYLGSRTRLYRPTWGLCNLWTLWTLRRWQHKLVLWSIMVGDWRSTKPQVLLQRILNKIHNGAIIVLHDSDETKGAEAFAPQNVIALIPLLSAETRRLGYLWATLSELL